ncbi:MAG: hypothetical protein RLZZ234_727 [Candidatus Parcubacteria bacterium]|jgi:hypothetical protein
MKNKYSWGAPPAFVSAQTLNISVERGLTREEAYGKARSMVRGVH